ncbi:hypothetical protein LC607_07460 [Nostoc sp. CHAB 5824]|nr:hypothetical protein [Nostoc sp. CHAB 5824]
MRPCTSCVFNGLDVVKDSPVLDEVGIGTGTDSPVLDEVGVGTDTSVLDEVGVDTDTFGLDGLGVVPDTGVVFGYLTDNHASKNANPMNNGKKTKNINSILLFLGSDSDIRALHN